LSISNLCDPDLPTLQTDRQTDMQSQYRTLYYSASRSKQSNMYLRQLPQWLQRTSLRDRILYLWGHCIWSLCSRPILELFPVQSYFHCTQAVNGRLMHKDGQLVKTAYV